MREREAEVRERDTRLVMATTALASSNTELLRYKRKCVPVCVCVDGPADPRSRLLTHLAHFAYPFMYVYLPSLYRPADDPQHD